MKLKNLIFCIAISAICMVMPLEKVCAQNMPTLKNGTEAPEITACDTLGKEHHLSDFRDKYVVVDFWASWCGDCRREFPAVKSLYATYHPKGVEFVSVSFDHKAESWKSCLRKEQFAWLQISTLQPWKANPISEGYELKWIPTLYIVDPDGKICGSAVTCEELAKKLDKIVSAK